MVTRVATITKEYTFEAAHQLMNHDGQCARLHGHSYKLQVSVRGPIKAPNGDPDEGMVIDFKVLDRLVKPTVEALDHRFLNDIIEGPATAENIAFEIYNQVCNAILDEGLEDRVIPATLELKLWETAKSSVTVRG